MEIREELIKKAKTCVLYLKNVEKKITFAESCTGGLLSFLISSIPGASEVFVYSLVTYSDSAKRGLLGVNSETLKVHGAVSSMTAREMAQGLLELVPGVDIAISITGFAGGKISQEGLQVRGSKTGTVFIGVAKKNLEPHATEFQFGRHTSRCEIQQKAAESALDTVLQQRWYL